MAMRKKQRVVTAVAALRRWLFGEKGIPKHILALLFLSLTFVIAMTSVTIMTSTDHRERTTPFGIPGRYLARQRNPTFFLVAINLFFSLIPLAFFALLHNRAVNFIKE